MVDFNALRAQAGELVEQHEDQIDAGVEKAGEMAKDRFAGHEQHIDMGVDKIQELTPDRDGDTPPAPAAGA